jgi:putative drug exporter of the RND superfamily
LLSVKVPYVDWSSPMLNLTRWTIAHRRTVVLAWIAALVGAIAVSSWAGSRYSSDFSLPNTDSERAVELLQERFPAQAGDSDQIVFRSRTGLVTDPSVRQAVEPMLERIADLPRVTDVVSPYETSGDGRAISQDGTIAFATVTFDERANELPVAAIERVVDAAQEVRSTDLQVELGGPATQQTQEPSVGSATVIGLAAAMVVLLLSFGSVIAMGLPIVTALFGLGIGISLIAIGTLVFDIVDFSTDLALMLGLGVGIDYALFIVTRFRDAFRENGGSLQDAIEVAMNTAGRAIVFAGVTVVIALMGLFALGLGFLYGVALATSAAVLLVLAASLTLLPALLAFTGNRVGRLRSRRWRRERSRGPGVIERWTALIQRRPGWSAIAATALLLALAAPALGLRLGASDSGNDPASTTTRRAYDTLAQGFGDGFNGPLLVVARLGERNDTAALDTLAATLRETPGVASVAEPTLSPARDAATMFVYPTTSPQSEATSDLVTHLRHDVIPAAEQSTGTDVFVGGATATQVDFSSVLADKLPLFIGIVVLLSALLLLVVFRSLLIPLQAAAMNLLSIAASLGVVVAIFQQGWLAGLTGVEPGPIEAFVPVLVFAIVFGLSMDYEVFLVSRIHEEWQHRGDHSAAVREGLARSGRVITAAAAIMMVVFASFAGGDLRVLQLFGVALATAVFLDAFVIRMVLLPAVLELFGRRTWWVPSWLDRRLPRLAIEPAPAVQPVPALEEAA